MAERLHGEALREAIESTRYYPEPVVRMHPEVYACHLLGLSEDTDLTEAQIAEAAEIAMFHMFTGREKI